MKSKRKYNDYKKAIVRGVNVKRKTYRGEVFGIIGSRIGFVKSQDLNKTFTISPDDMESFFPGDLVEFELTDSKKGGVNIVGLLRSDFKKFTGEFYEDETGAYVIPDVYGLSRKIRVPKSFIKYGEKSGDLVSAEIIEHPFLMSNGKAKRAKASILGVISKSDSSTRESSYCIYKNDLPSRFSTEVLNSVASIPVDFIADKSKERVDLRSIPFISIDSPSAFDIDDSIYVERLDFGYKMYVSIADVSEFIKEGSQLDKDIFERASSVYLLGQYIPMLPNELSRLCSLDSGGDVLSLTVEVDIKTNGDVLRYDIYESVIRDNMKLSYDFVEEIVEGFPVESIDGVVRYNGIEVGDKHIKSIFNMYNLHMILISKRDDTFSDVEDGGFRVELDNKTKRINNISKVGGKTSKSMVRECMLLANYTIAKFIIESGSGFGESIFVVRDGIKNNRINEVKVIASRINKDFKVEDLNCINGFNRFLSGLSKDYKEIILGNVKDSVYSNNYKGNYYRGLEYYTQFTSPLRRYADIMVHRQVKGIIRNKNIRVDNGFSIDKLNAKIRNIRKTESDVENWLKYYYLLENFRNRPLEAIVTSISDSNITVKLVDSGVTGVVITNKTFKERNSAIYDSESYSLILGDGRVVNALTKVYVAVRDFEFVNKKIVFRLI